MMIMEPLSSSRPLFCHCVFFLPLFLSSPRGPAPQFSWWLRVRYAKSREIRQHQYLFNLTQLKLNMFAQTFFFLRSAAGCTCARRSQYNRDRWEGRVGRGWLGGMNRDGERISGRCVGEIFRYNGLQIWTRKVSKARHGAKLGLDRLTPSGQTLWTPSFEKGSTQCLG